MSFDNFYPNRKDHRKPFHGSKSVDRTCRNHGSCPYCSGNRQFKNFRRQPLEIEYDYSTKESFQEIPEGT